MTHVCDPLVQAGGPHWEVEAGRRDGSVSQASDTLGPLPGPGSNVNTLNTAFSNQGLSQTDMVALSGTYANLEILSTYMCAFVRAHRSLSSGLS